MEDMEFRRKRGQRIPKWKIILAPICWILRRHFWDHASVQTEDMPEDSDNYLGTAKCRLCAVFYHEWW